MKHSKILFLSIAYDDHFFSENGQFIRSSVNSLNQESTLNNEYDSSTQCMVICAVPENMQRRKLHDVGLNSDQSNNAVNSARGWKNISGTPDNCLNVLRNSHENININVLKVPVPIVNSLKLESSWKEFGLGVSKYVDCKWSFFFLGLYIDFSIEL